MANEKQRNSPSIYKKFAFVAKKTIIIADKTNANH